jgi:ABC-type glycerol-3-phosphate transport system substrate-binding protein
LPVYVTPHIIVYRKSWLAEVGKQPPNSWETLYDVTKAVTNPGRNRFGFAIPFSDIHGGKPVWGFLLSNGVTIFEKDNQGKWKLNIDQPATVETYEYLYKLMKDTAPPGVVSYNTNDIRELVAKSVIMSRFDTPEVLNAVREVDPAMVEDFGFVPLPARKRLGSSQGWVGLVAYEKGNVPLAKSFMEFMFGGDRLVNFYVSYPYAMFPAVAALYDNPAYAQGVPDELKPLVPLAPEILKSSAGISMWNGDNPWAGEIENKSLLSNALSDMLVEGISARQAVNNLTAELKRLMGE